MRGTASAVSYLRLWYAADAGIGSQVRPGLLVWVPGHDALNTKGFFK
jgi:hypothetical protein